MGNDVKATLRFPLPDGAVVSGFQLQVGEQMMDALAVTKQKAAAVAYKEKEKGRAVATTEAVQGDIWSTEVFPLPHGAERTVTLSFRCECPMLEQQGEGGAAWALSLPICFGKEVSQSIPVTCTTVVPGSGPELTVTDNIGGAADAEQLSTGGLRIALLSTAPPAPALRMAVCPLTGQRHFSGVVPAPAIQAALGAAAGKPELHGTARPAVSVCIVWDTSSSTMEPIEKKPAAAGAKKPAAEEEAAVAAKDPKLQLLLDQVIAAYARQDTELTLSVFTLSTA